MRLVKSNESETGCKTKPSTLHTVTFFHRTYLYYSKEVKGQKYLCI